VHDKGKRQVLKDLTVPGTKIMAMRKKSGGKGTRSKKATKTRAKTRPRIVIRRTGGRREKFDKEKMAQTVSRSGTPFQMARDVAKKISRKVARNREEIGRKKGSEVVIDGSVIREMVIEELRSRNRPDIAASLSGESPENAGLDTVRDQMVDNAASGKANNNLLFDNSTMFAKSTTR
jgi:transcriptional regulator NrdR family protein